MVRVWVVMMWLVTGLALAGPAAAQEVPKLVVTGEGIVATAPDMASIRLGVTAEADTATAAMDEVSAKVKAILSQLTTLGIEARDVQTSNLSLAPRWTQSGVISGGRRIDGYVASNQVTVRVRALPDLGAILQAVLADGANQMNGLTFGFAEPRPLMDIARARAVADAQAKALVYEKAAGLKLGAVLDLREAGGGQHAPVFAEARMAMDAVPIAAGEAQLTARVTITYALEQ